MRTFIFISILVALGPSVVASSNTAHVTASFHPATAKYGRACRAADWAEKMTEKPGEQMKVAREVHNTGARLDGNTKGGNNFPPDHVGEESPSAGNWKSGDSEMGIDGQRDTLRSGSASQIEEAAPRRRNSHSAGSGPLKGASHMEGAGQGGGISRLLGGESGRASQMGESGQRGESSHSAEGGELGSASQRGGSPHSSESRRPESTSQPEGAGQQEERSRSSGSGLPGSSPQRKASQGVGFSERGDKSRYRKPRLQNGEY